MHSVPWGPAPSVCTLVPDLNVWTLSISARRLSAWEEGAYPTGSKHRVLCLRGAFCYCVNERKVTVLTHYTRGLKAYFILKGILLKHRNKSFSPFSMD